MGKVSPRNIKTTSGRPFFCQQPDIDEPRLRCGHPMPCPRHSVLVVIDTEEKGTKPARSKKSDSK